MNNGNVRPKICFVFPPFSESAFHGPHLAIPLLRAVLKEMGVQTVSEDLNIQTIRSILDPEMLDQLLLLCTRDEHQHVGASVDLASAINTIQSRGLDTFVNSGSAQLKQFLQLARLFLFPTPADLEECIKERFHRPQLATELYSSFAERLVGSGATCFAFSVAFSDQLVEAIELACLIRNRKPEAVIWLGGSQINLLQPAQIAQLAECKWFDAVSVGNGEQTISSLVDDLFTDGATRNIYRSGSMGPEELNELPSPLFQENLIDYFSPTSMPVLVTKGCYWGKCTFCDYPKLSNLGGRRYIARDVEAVLQEIGDLQSRYDVDQINLISDAIPPAWYRRLAQRALGVGLELKTWSYMMHHRSLDRDFFNLLAAAGVRVINFGTESMIERILEVMNKQASPSDIQKNVFDAFQAGVTIVCNFIPDYPTTTREEAFENLAMVADLLPMINSLNPQMFDLTAGTAIESNPELFELKIDRNAYVKTNHGYHSVSFSRDRSITRTDRNVLQDAFYRMKRTALTKRREVTVDPDAPNTLLTLDGSLVFLGDGTAWIMSTASRWKMANWERDLIEPIFDRQQGPYITLGELSQAFDSGDRPPSGFENWLRTLVQSGTILQAD